METPTKNMNAGFCEHSGKDNSFLKGIGLLAILQKSLDPAFFIFIREVLSSGVRGSPTIVHIRTF